MPRVATLGVVYIDDLEDARKIIDSYKTLCDKLGGTFMIRELPNFTVEGEYHEKALMLTCWGGGMTSTVLVFNKNLGEPSEIISRLRTLLK